MNTREQTVQRLHRYSAPLFTRSRAGDPELIGTGFIVQKDEEFFLVTAGHVLDEKKELATFWSATSPTMLRGPVISTASVVENKKQTRLKDQLDVSVMYLSNMRRPENAELRVAKFCDLCPEAMPRAGKEYFFSGFPASRASTQRTPKSLKAPPVHVHSTALDAAVLSNFSLPERLHIPIAYERKQGGITLPSPSGLSGSPVWSTRDGKDVIVGVLVEYHAEFDILLATDISIAISHLIELQEAVRRFRMGEKLSINSESAAILFVDAING